ncbi:hypothetical protein FGO68_gene5529 [Halteria grandinella]|uniref:Uncharacterized protein n=1 Tax=Halteria grandinella TaxID=5974 RepID=A0A8J8SUF8_HALGN|nr:hypothetical protein FGO68_gene5529 [Halteria grandinella]
MPNHSELFRTSSRQSRSNTRVVKPRENVNNFSQTKHVVDLSKLDLQRNQFSLITIFDTHNIELRQCVNQMFQILALWTYTSTICSYQPEGKLKQMHVRLRQLPGSPRAGRVDVSHVIRFGIPTKPESTEHGDD